MKAMISFVGAGPGDPELITVKGRRILDNADVVIYAGSLVNPALLTGIKLSFSLLAKPAGQFSAWLRLRSNPREVELANFNAAGAPLASVRLTASGDIELRAAPGHHVRVVGDLEAERIRYQPFGGGARQNL